LSPITTLPLSQPNQRSITQHPLKMHRLPTSAHANLNTKIQIAPPKFCIKLSQQQHPKICRHAATFLTESITAWQGALRIKRNASETKIPKPPHYNRSFRHTIASATHPKHGKPCRTSMLRRCGKIVYYRLSTIHFPFWRRKNFYSTLVFIQPSNNQRAFEMNLSIAN